MGLRATHEALECGDNELALDTLLTHWYALRVPETADLIDLVSQRIAQGRSPLSGRSAAAREQDWQDRIQHRLDRAMLIPAPWPKKLKHAEDRLVQLRKIRGDPRISIALAELAVALPYRTSTADSFWGMAFDLIRRNKDLRCINPLKSVPQHAYRFPHRLEQMVQTVLAKLQAQAPLQLSSEDAAWVQRIRTMLTAHGPDSESLYAQVYAKPCDDTPRAVLADALIESGDDRGEFIALQLQRERSGKEAGRRERALLKAHAKDFAGALDPWIDTKGRLFRRGFLAGARVHTAPTPVSPAWSTLEILAGAMQLPTLLEAREALRTLHDVPEPLAIHLANDPQPWGIETLTTSSIKPIRGPGLPRLTHVGITYSHYLNREEVHGLVRLDLLDSAGSELATLRALAETSIQTLCFLDKWSTFWTPQHWVWRFDRDHRGGFGKLTGSFRSGTYSFSVVGHNLIGLLKGLPNDLLSSIHIQKGRSVKPDVQMQETFDTLLRRFTSLECVDVPW